MKNQFRHFILAAASGVFLSACVSVPNPSANDPLESYNRSMFAVNEAVDKAVIRPIASGYKAAMPTVARTCVGNIFGNLDDIWSGINSMLQGRGLDFVNTMGRVLFNSTVGLGGCIDVASKNGSPKIKNDFGTTLGVWGIGGETYVVLPLLGSSSWRDAVGSVGDSFGTTAAAISPWAIPNVSLRNFTVTGQLIDKRAQLLDADDTASDVAIDKYSFVRDAYKQNRESLLMSKLRDEITDGTPVTGHLFVETTESGNPLPGAQRQIDYRTKKREERLNKLAQYDKFTVPDYEDPGE